MSGQPWIALDGAGLEPFELLVDLTNVDDLVAQIEALPGLADKAKWTVVGALRRETGETGAEVKR